MHGVRVLIAPDSFGSSLTADEAADVIAGAWRSVAPDDDVLTVIAADDLSMVWEMPTCDDPRSVAEIYRAPDLHASLFFAFFILTDPPTSPTRYAHQIICGALVAVVSFAVFEGLGAAHYLLAGVLVGNVYEGVRRSAAKTPSSQLTATS